VKIRLRGTGAECRAAAGRLTRAPVLAVLSVSAPRADRGTSALVRVYAGARLDPAPAGHRGSRLAGPCAGEYQAEVQPGSAHLTTR